MVRVDKDLKRCYFYRIKIPGDVKQHLDQRTPSPEFPKSEIPRNDIIPYNPHFRERNSRATSRPSSNRRISWSREADRIKEISPRSEPEPVKIFYPPPAARQTRSFSQDYIEPVDKYPLKSPKKKKKIKKKKPENPKNTVEPQPKPIISPEPFFEPIYPLQKSAAKSKPAAPKTASANRKELIGQQREKRYKAQKLEQAKRHQSNLRKIKSESNLRSIPKEPLMKKADSGKTKHINPPRWRHVGDRTRHHKDNKNSRSFASDYYF